MGSPEYVCYPGGTDGPQEVKRKEFVIKANH